MILREAIDDAEKRTKEIELHIRDFKLILIGLALGVIGNLWANLIWELFKGYEFLFSFFLLFLTLAVFKEMLGSIIKIFDTGMTGNPLLNKRWEEHKNLRAERPFMNDLAPKILGAIFGLTLILIAVYLWLPELPRDLMQVFKEFINK